MAARMSGSTAVVMLSLEENGEFVFSLALDETPILTTTHPGAVAAILFASGAARLKVSHYKNDPDLVYRTLFPLEAGDLTGLNQLAGEHAQLRALLGLMYGCYVHLDLANEAGDVLLPSLIYHWHAACRILPPSLVIRCPKSEPPADLEEWMLEQRVFYRQVSRDSSGTFLMN